MTTGAVHFDMIHYGGYLSALSPFWMVAFDKGPLVLPQTRLLTCMGHGLM